MNDERAKKKVVIDSGHGGDDSGTVHNGIVEKDLTLKISNYIKERLDDLGIENSLSRTGDELLDQNARPERIQSFYGNGSDVIVLSNHINAGGGDGAEVIYALRNSDTLARKITNELENAGQNVRKFYQKRLPSDPSKDYYYLLRKTPNNETVIVEYGFADSTGDDANLLKNDWQTLAEAVVKGLAEYIGVPYSVKGDNYYIVVKGDSLWSIAKKFNTTVDKLKELNNLSTNNLSIGQKLVVTAPAKDTDTYIVQKGDTLYAIAGRFGTTVANLMSINNLSTPNLAIGQVLRIPSVSSSETYVVKAGDTLYAIANRFNTDVQTLKNINNLTTNNLSIGQVLKIPTNSANNIYTVVAGDSLYSIAGRFGTTVSVLKNANNLKSDLLSIGQKLIIP